MSLVSMFVKCGEFFNDRNWNGFKTAGIEEKKDVVYDENNPKICRLDIYRKQTTRELPVIINIHGGSFVGGSKKGRRGFGRYMANEGFAVVNIGYGLSPKYKFIDFLRQAAIAVKYIESHAKEYKMDLSKVFVCGDSAGGYIASALAALSCNPEYGKLLDATEFGIKFVGAVFFTGVYDPEKMLSEKLILNSGKVIGKQVFDYDISEDIKKYKHYAILSPVKFINGNFPATFVSHTENDILCPRQGGYLVQKLKENGIPIWEFHAVETKCPHDWQLFYKNKTAEECLIASIQFMRSAIEGNYVNKVIEI